jgi:DNA-binding transcriptional LysR family regulator
MDALQSMRVFERVAQRSNFSRAARELRMSPAAVTKHVASLEARVGVRLFDRTTRHVALTEAGRLYLERCLECLQAFDDADAAVSEMAREPAGLLRITAPVDLASHLGRVVGDFMNAHPRVVVDLRLSNRSADLVDEGIDVALRVAQSLDGRFVARPIALVRGMLCASPAYLDAHGRPRKPQDLATHRNLIFAEPRPSDELVLERGGKTVKVKVRVQMISNNGAATREVTLAGAGIGELPSFCLTDEFESGRLEVVLPQWTYRSGLRLFAIYPHRRFVPAKVRLFIDLLRARFGA